MKHQSKVILVTGAGRRIGRDLALYLHQQGWQVIIHYHHSAEEAKKLVQQCNDLREHSAACIQANLNHTHELKYLAEQAIAQWKRLDAVIHNASTFFPTPFGSLNETHWEQLMHSNFKAPLFLNQWLLPELKRNKGSIIHILDAHLTKLKTHYSLYYAAKSALFSLTRTLALELAPDIRVNGISPGAMLWPEGINAPDEIHKSKTLSSIPMQRIGNGLDIAKTAHFLLEQSYITGEIIKVDGGRSLA